MDQNSEIIQAPAATVGDQAGQAETSEQPFSLSESIDLEVFTGAAEGQIEEIRKHRDRLHLILTPTKNTVLHICIAYATKLALTKSEKAWRSRKQDPFHEWLFRPLEILRSALEEKPLYTSSPTFEEKAYFVNELLEMCPPLLLQPNNSGDTALHIAARTGHAGIVEALIKAAKGDLEKQVGDACQMLIRTPNKEGNTALHEAARFNHLDVVKILTREDPDFLHSTNVAGETPIYLAAERGYRNLVFEILNTCTHPSYRGHSGRTALHAAVINQDEDMTGKILEKEKAKGKEKILTKATDKQGWTPLHFAALFGDTPIAIQLLDCDKSVAYLGDRDDNKTALHIAASKGHGSVMKELISRCPDCCELVDQKGRNILHYVVENKRFGLEYIIQEHPWLSNILLNGKDDDGNTPLHLLAVSLSNRSRLLLDYRVDFMALNNKNQNALDIILADDTFSMMTGIKQRKYVHAFGIKGARQNVRKVYDDRKVQKNEVGRDTGDNEAKNVLLLVATLIATVSFAAGFTMPGGYQSEKGPNQGFAVLARNGAFKAFVVTNTIAMVMSSTTVLTYLFMAILPLLGKKLKYLQSQISYAFIALIAMTIAFITGTYAVLGGSSRLGMTVLILSFYSFTGIIGSLFD